MSVVLEQAKLNVINKSRSSIFNWRGQFTPQFVEYILQKFSSEGDVIVYIFRPFWTLQRYLSLRLDTGSGQCFG